jgi:hypothetical protein
LPEARRGARWRTPDPRSGSSTLRKRSIFVQADEQLFSSSAVQSSVPSADEHDPVCADARTAAAARCVRHLQPLGTRTSPPLGGPPNTAPDAMPDRAGHRAVQLRHGEDSRQQIDQGALTACPRPPRSWGGFAKNASFGVWRCVADASSDVLTRAIATTPRARTASLCSPDGDGVTA